MIASDRVLMHYDPSLPILVACDASPYGYGAVVSHITAEGIERPIAFASRSLKAAEKNYAQIHRETLSIYWRVKKIFPMLFGRHFTLLTDHEPLVSIFHPEKGIPYSVVERLKSSKHAKIRVKFAMI